MNIINKNVIRPNINHAQLTDGINLSRKEFASVGIVVRNLAKKHGEGKFQDETLLVNDFRSEMRQIFDVHITFEELKTKDNKPSAMKVVACRFKKKRPLIFLGYETDNKTWFVLDEKRFPVLEDPNSPFLGVNI
jgi:hypothetical protein